MPRTIDNETATLFADSLKVSYPSVTPEHCKETADAILAGEYPPGIVAMFIRRMLNDAGLLA